VIDEDDIIMDDSDQGQRKSRTLRKRIHKEVGYMKDGDSKGEKEDSEGERDSEEVQSLVD
jgi:hypothetical protein